MNENIFLQWIDHFNDIMTSSNKWPAMLILDVCASHWNNDIIENTVEMSIILFLFPESATDLVQNFDITMLNTFKETHNKEIDKNITPGNGVALRVNTSDKLVR